MRKFDNGPTSKKKGIRKALKQKYKETEHIVHLLDNRWIQKVTWK